MNVLVIGGGGREHAIIKKLSESREIGALYCAPGNGGIAQNAVCVDIKATDIHGIVDFAIENKINLVVVAPDDPLAMGMVDRLQMHGIKAFGPTKAAAEIESSKAFAKNLMRKYNIPTADYAVFEDYEAARAYIETRPAPMVVKADGLALGKGVLICETREQALEAAQAANEENRVQSAARLETAANARGFGRSSYATDMLQRNEYEANRNEAALQGDYADALLQLEAGRNASAAQYAGSMWQSQQQAVLEAQRFNAQQSQEAALRQWEAENDLRKAYYEASAAYAANTSGSGRSSSGRKSSSSSSKKVSSAVLEEEKRASSSSQRRTAGMARR